MLHRSTKISAAALLIVSQAPGIVRAAPDTSADDDVIQEVLVTARSIEDTLPLELMRYGHDVELVSAERIAAAGYVDVSTALQHEVPGLFVSPGSGPFDYVDVSLQGSRTDDVLWLIDGVRINNRLYNDTSPDTLPAAMVERIEVLKGGESLFYGTQGVAGAINIVTRSFSDELDGNVSLSFDSHDGRHASGYVRGAAGDHKFLAYASKNEGDGYRQYDIYEPSATDRDRGYEVENVGLKYGYDLTERLRVDALYQHTDAVLEFNRPFRTRRGYNDRDEDIASLKLSYEASDRLALTLKGYLHDWDTTYANIQNHPVTGEEVVVYPPGTYWGFRDVGASALVRLTPGGLAEYHFGYDYQRYEGRDEVVPIATETETVHALYGQIRSSKEAFDDLALAAGARYNRASGGKGATVWNVSARYDISDTLYLEGLVATAFLLPSAEQLYYQGEQFDDYVGNPDLLPEKSRNVNLSIGGTLGREPRLQWRLTGYARDVDDLIDVGYENPAYPNGRYENVEGTVQARGAEVWLAASLTGAVALSTSFAVSRTREEGSDQQIARIPERFAKAALRYAPPGARFEASLSASWTGDVYQNTRTAGRCNFGDHATASLAGSLYLDPARHHRIGVHIENVFDKAYATRLVDVERDDGSRSLARRLGVPRTFKLSYVYDF